MSTFFSRKEKRSRTPLVWADLSIALIGWQGANVYPLVRSLQLRGCFIVRTSLERFLALSEHCPLIVVLNQQSTDRDLLRKLIKLRGSNTQLGIVVLGRSVDNGVQAQFIEMGADDYIAWPFDARDVLSRINVLARAVGLPELPRHQSQKRRRGF